MNSPKSWDLEIKDSVWKELKSFPHKDGVRLLEAIRLLPENPYAGDTRKVKGEEYAWRRRVGSYRIVYEVYTVQALILVFRVRHRTSNIY